MSLDRISTLPQPILETIICLLPTDEAVRTSILSREWRYKWTHIPKLRFNLLKRTSELTSEIANAKKYMDMHDVHQIVLRHQGLIHEFSLVLDDYWEHYDCFECDQIILHLSRNHRVKKLTLFGLFESEGIWYKLPESVFALHHLTDLCLHTFEIDHPSIFGGFRSLERLELDGVKNSAQTLLHLLSNCPSLKNLTLHIDETGDTCTINELLKCLPAIEDLTISGDVSEWLVLDSVPHKLPASLIHLKSLCLNQFCLGEGGSTFLLVLIKCSPNLEHAFLEIEWGLEEFSAVKDEYSDVWLDHLNELDVCFCSSLLDTGFVKFIMARSPKLKSVDILHIANRKQANKMKKALLRAPCASPAVKITASKI